MTADSRDAQRSSSSTRARLIAGRLALLLVPFMVLGVAEWAARITTPPIAERQWRSPYLRPLRDPDSADWIRDLHGERLYSNDPAMQTRALERGLDRRVFTEVRKPGSLRIFSLGASTTYGLGSAPYVSYSRFLEARLRVFSGRDDLEVVNLGVSGYDSHDLVPLADEALEHGAGLLVVYAGHNELKYPNLARVLAPSAEGLKTWLGESALLRCLVRAPTGPPEQPGLFERRPALSELQRERARELYTGALRRVVEHARERGVPVLLCTPASNVRDKEPRLTILAAADDSRAAADERLLRDLGARWSPGVELARGAPVPTPEQTADDLRTLDGILVREPQAAMAHFLRGRVLLGQARDAEAAEAFQRSLEEDGLPERAPPDLVRALRELADAQSVPLADVEARIEQVAEHGIPGFDLFWDYCHPNLLGHWWIADEILATLRRSGLEKRLGLRLDLSKEPLSTDPHAAMNAYLEQFGFDSKERLRASIQEAQMALGEASTTPDRREPLIEKAVQSCEAVLRSDPNLVEAQLVLAVAAAARGQRALAVRWLESATELDTKVVAEWATRVALQPWFLERFESVGIAVHEGGFSIEPADSRPAPRSP